MSTVQADRLAAIYRKHGVDPSEGDAIVRGTYEGDVVEELFLNDVAVLMTEQELMRLLAAQGRPPGPGRLRSTGTVSFRRRRSSRPYARREGVSDEAASVDSARQALQGEV